MAGTDDPGSRAMESDALSTEMQSLLDHAQWVRQLALSLVRDPNTAEDLTQEAMLAALKVGDNMPHSPRAWFRAVVRKLAWERLRREDRRTGREEVSARDESTPPTELLLQRMAVHRRVVEAVMELPEHYREILLRRFFEGESPTAISNALGLPVSTVRTRLSRALDRTRDKLDSEYGGDGKNWVTALAPLLAPAEIGSRSRDLTAVAAAAIGAAALLAIGFWVAGGEPGPVNTVAIQSSEVSSRPIARPLDPDALPPSSRVPEPPDGTPHVVATRPNNTPASIQPESGRLRGRAIDSDGNPIASAVLRLESLDENLPFEAMSLSTGDGSFEFPAQDGRGRIFSAGGSWVTLFAGLTAPDSGKINVVLAARQSLGGIVMDSNGNRMEGARVSVHPQQGLRQRLGAQLESSSEIICSANTDAEGAFHLPDAPNLVGGWLRAEREGFADIQLPLPPYSDLGLQLVLERPTHTGSVVIGVVVDANGRPQSDVLVSTGRSVTSSDSFGRFEFSAQELIDAEQLLAISNDKRFAKLMLEPETPYAGGIQGQDEELRIQLNEAPQSIEGQVVDLAGNGVPRVRLWLLNPTPFKLPDDQETSSVTRRFDWGAEHDPNLLLVENLLSDGRSAYEPLLTDDQGRFQFEGLLRREYRLVGMHSNSLLRAESSLLATGTRDARIVMDANNSHRLLKGTLVDQRGTPLAGIRVWLHLRTFEWPHGGGLEHRGPSFVTGKQGEFWFRDVPLRSSLVVEGDGLWKTVLSKADELKAFTTETGGKLTVTSAARVHVISQGEADAVEFRAQDGTALPVLIRRGGLEVQALRVELWNGLSEELSVPTTAVEMILFKQTSVLNSTPLELARGSKISIQL